MSDAYETSSSDVLAPSLL